MGRRENERSAGGQGRATGVLRAGGVIPRSRMLSRSLKESEERYRSLVTATALLVWTTNARGEVVEDLPAWRSFTGQTVDEIRGWGWTGALHPDDREHTSRIWSDAVAARALYETEYRLRRHDGEYRFVVARGVPVLGPDGSIREWVGTCEDITERKEMEKRRGATSALLELFAAKPSRAEYLDALPRLLCEVAGCRCAGVRVVDTKRQIPYGSYIGFSQAFWESENCLSLDRDQCACARVVLGAPETQDLPVMTPGGSFHCPNVAEFVAGLCDEERLRFRGVCVSNGLSSVTIVPIGYQGEVLGAIHLADEEPGRIARGALELVESLGPLIGEAFNRYSLKEELRRSAAEQSALFSVVSAAQTLLDPDWVVAAALDALLPVVGGDAGWVILPGATAADLPHIAATRGVPASLLAAEVASPLDNCLVCGPVLCGAVPGMEPRPIGACPRLPPAAIAEAGLGSHVGIPLVAKTRVLGFLNIAWKADHPASAEELALLMAAGGQIGIVLENARLFEAEHSARLTVDALREASLMLTETLEMDTVLTALLESLSRLIPFDRARVMALDADSRLVVRAVRETGGAVEMLSGDAESFDVRTNPVLQAVLLGRDGLLIPDTRAHLPWASCMRTEFTRCWMGVPLVSGDDLIGLYTLSTAKPGLLTEGHLRTAEALSAQAAVAIRNASLYAQVRTGRERLQTLSRQLVDAQEAERRRIARVLHDEAGQALASLKVGLHLLEREAAEREDVSNRVSELRQAADTVLEQLHSLAAELRPASLDHLGLVPALRQLVATLNQDGGPAIELEAVGLGATRLPQTVETALYRIAQEALTNSLRHAGASRVSVLLRAEDDRVIALVEDDGLGFEHDTVMASGGLGLAGMRERAEILNGRLRIESSPGRGTTVLVEVPYSPAGIDR